MAFTCFLFAEPGLTLILEASFKEGRMKRGREKGAWGEVRHL